MASSILGHCSIHCSTPSMSFDCIPIAGFDEYFTSLRPPLLLSHCQSQQPPQESPTGHSTRLNCRNPWFRQFWHALHWHHVLFISLDLDMFEKTCSFRTCNLAKIRPQTQNLSKMNWMNMQKLNPSRKYHCGKENLSPPATD